MGQKKRKNSLTEVSELQSGASETPSLKKKKKVPASPSLCFALLTLGEISVDTRKERERGRGIER